MSFRPSPGAGPTGQVTVSNVDGARAMFDAADVIIASAGATHPLSSWLDALKPGGRLMFPMTTTREGPGAMLLVVRQDDEAFAARFIHRVGFIPSFQGARNQGASRRLAATLRRDWGAAVRSLRRDQHPKADTCWLHAKSWVCRVRFRPTQDR